MEKVLPIQQIGMSSVRDQQGFYFSGKKRFPRLGRTGKQYDGGPMSIVPGPILAADLTPQPGKITLTRFLAQEFLFVMAELCDNPTAGDIVVIDKNEPSGRFKGRGKIEGNGSFRAQRHLGHLILRNRGTTLLLIEIGGVDDSMDRGHFTFNFTSRQANTVLPATFKRALTEPEEVDSEDRGHKRQGLLM